MTKACPRCGKAFACANPEPGCWCESVPTDPGTLSALSGLYEDCLCPDCLKALSGAPPGTS